MSPSKSTALDPWYLETLVCPADQDELRQEGCFLVSRKGRRYPVVDGMPVMLRDDVPETIGAARASLQIAHKVASDGDSSDSPLYLEAVGCSDDERETARRLHARGGWLDPVVAVMLGATSGLAYKGRDTSGQGYPIPAFRFPTPRAGRVIDIGCNWGRWTIAAAQAGHEAVGIDPQLGAVLAARRVASQLGVSAKFVVADGRHLPFRPGLFDYSWSYSVLQHLSRPDVVSILRELRRVVRRGGLIRIQMANSFGVRSLYYLLRRRLREPKDFEVRYWTPGSLRTLFQEHLGPAEISADCYLGLGLQWSDFGRLNRLGQAALLVSEVLRKTSTIVPPLTFVADSLFCTAQRAAD